MTMKVTNTAISLISDGLREKRMNQATLAESLGYQQAWASKLLNGKIENLSEETVDAIEKLLDISFVQIKRSNRPVSSVAQDLSFLADADEDMAELLIRLRRISSGKLYHRLPFLPTKDLVEFGEEIMRAAHADPDKPGKIGRIAMEWLSLRLSQLGESTVE